MARERRQGVFWMLTIPRAEWKPPTELPADMSWIKGQAEIGEGGYEHWQVLVAYKQKKTLAQCKSNFTRGSHCELSRSEAAGQYVWKEDTAVQGTRFEFGAKPFRRAERTDWQEIWDLAIVGNLERIPPSVRIHHYGNLLRIRGDHVKPVAMERTCYVYWGPTGTGKSRRAWDEAGMEAYCKDPRTKFWCGYSSEKFVVIDEFRGGIDVTHILRWLDRYPVRVEIKGAAVCLCAETIWITSNVDPKNWWPDIDDATYLAFKRRVKVTQFHQTI